MLNENALRRQMIEKRKHEFAVKPKSLSDYESKIIVDNCVKLINFICAKNVMIYLPLSGEADITGLVERKLKFFVPVTHGVEIMPACYDKNTRLVRGEFNVSVPESPVYADKHKMDLVFVPAVAVDGNKNRMGFGKGCYDRFLADMRCVKAAVCFDFQIVDKLEPKSHDVRMDYIVTESGYF